MYMHTLDDQPASFQWLREQRDGEVVTVGYIHFVGGRNKAKLVKTRAEIVAQQKRAMRDCANSVGGHEWSDPKHYGYVLVEVPTP